jgi:photosystem II stability/assembly factor-like uncharacterized protein
MKTRTVLRVTCHLVFAGLLSTTWVWADGWRLLGPDGGDARSLAYNPRNPDQIYLGTSTGTLFISTDGGRSWSHFAHLGVGEDYVLDHIVIDPRRPQVIFVSAWNVADQKSGDVFRTKDDGKTWVALPGMHGKSIRALAMAPSDSRVLVSGSLDGVYRSKDAGDSWERVSPPAYADIRNIESIAIDPKDPNIIYAGTWHLAWKTRDGGARWQHISKGMIDDSDVFSLIVDPNNSSVVYASACSGIYKSTVEAEVFQKVQGIPFSARRTRVLKFDPSHSEVVYAGTTQGLWKTLDAGKVWKEIGNSNTVINDVLVDPRNSSNLLLATDRSGVLASDNGGMTFSPSNHGYTHRYVTAILADKRDPGTIFVGVANDREWGGVFLLRERDRQWRQESAGLGGRDVFALEQAEDSTLIAGTNRGIFVLDSKASAWRPSSNLAGFKPPTLHGRVTKTSLAASSRSNPLAEARVNKIEIKPERWLTATSAGLFVSNDKGKSWSGGPVLGRTDLLSVQSQGNLIAAVTRTEVLVSENGGKDWQLSGPAEKFTNIRSLTVTRNAEILIAAREGAFRSSDSGRTWQGFLHDLAETDLSSIWCEDSEGVLLVSSLSTGVIFESHDGGRRWDRGPDSGYPLRSIKLIHGRLVGATPFDGVIVQE